MQIVLVGGSGMIGQRIAQEALSRGHSVTVVVRNLDKLTLEHERLRAVAHDASDSAGMQQIIAGSDAVISAVAPPLDNPDTLVTVTQQLAQATLAADVQRLLVVGGAGSLEVAPGVALVNTPDFPDFIKPIALAHDKTLSYLRSAAPAALAWTYLSPAITIEPGPRTGSFRLGHDQVLFDAQGQSRISAEDFAVALINELEQPAHTRQRFTLAY